MSLSQRATCRILNGHKELTSLFEAAEGVGQKRGGGRKGGRKGGYRRSETEKVVAAEIIGKANPESLGVFLKKELERTRGGTEEFF